MFHSVKKKKVNMGKCGPLLTKKALETYFTCLEIWTVTVEILCNC